MEKINYEYPVVFIKNEESGIFNAFVPDLFVFAESKTQKQATIEVKMIAKKFLQMAKKYQTEIPIPSTIEDVENKWKGWKVSLMSFAI